MAEAPALTTADFWVGPVLGEGAFGVVRVCRHKATGRSAAVKVVAKRMLQKHPAVRRALLQEQRLLRQELKGLSGVVELWAAFHDAQCLYLVMECLEGGSLRDRLTSHRGTGTGLPRQAASQYGRGILQALREIHAHGVLHADVTPANILLTGRGGVKLCDFGSAVLLPDPNRAMAPAEAYMGHSLDDGPADAVVPRGTAGYASPEILRGAPSRSLTWGADVWSLGCVVHEIVWGQTPFGAATDAAAVDRTLDYANLPDPEERAAWLFGARDGVDDGASGRTAMRDLILTMLEPDPARRALGLSMDDWYAQIANHPAWDIVQDEQEEAFILPDTRIGCTSEQEFVDGQAGWSAFLL